MKIVAHLDRRPVSLAGTECNLTVSLRADGSVSVYGTTDDYGTLLYMLLRARDRVEWGAGVEEGEKH